MNHQAGPPGEMLAAFLTTIRSIPGVNALMNHEVGLMSEPLKAVTADVRSFAGSLIFPLVPFNKWDFAAPNFAAGFIPFGYQIHERNARGGVLFAPIDPVEFLRSLMTLHMVGKVRLLSEAPVTFVARERRFSGMSS